MEIGIIGAGAAGVSVLDALSLADAEPGGVTVFEGSPRWWRGRAYQPDLDAVRVNAPPVIMSIRHGDRSHYPRWLARRDGDADAHQDELLGVPIVPRAVYGEYLEATALEAITRLRQRGWRVDLVGDRVTGHSPPRTPGGEHPVDHAVLCVGGGTPVDHYGLAGSRGFVLDPYPLARTLADVPTGGHVLVIGSGLTAVDIVAALAADGHTGPITMVSRGGVLPDVQQTPVQLDFRHLTRENLPSTLTGLVSLMNAELAEAGQDIAPLTAEITTRERPVDRLRRQLAEVDSPYLGRRMFAAAVHMLGPAAWRLLSLAERTVLRTEHFRTITSLASPMVPGNARTLLALFDSGQLRLVPGVPKIEPGPRGFRVSSSDDLTADVVLNATNPPTGGLHTVGATTTDTFFVTPSVPTLAAVAATTVAEILSTRPPAR
ncbi:hypothetical protein ADK67_26440 [Saccharothrix sp. NRRL B-16348]|uniref:FAD/NAD(P)-binding protein n=1 Tax=Saccharothrix sp. NRRL B-16348 TaxID=1415542 RepID=UPI0006AD8523|nr:FAD/NAD(P)-binding protein [Saccharothrix sp. NRRL B-16348]KOX21535.1 hypothetical protein ADK67_26440 [Saccharothrix sp. NRRL B-16348]